MDKYSFVTITPTQFTSAIMKTPLDFVDSLLDSKTIDSQTGQRVVAALETSGQPIDLVFSELGLLEEDKLATKLSAFFSVPIVRSNEFPITAFTTDELDPEFLEQNRIIPVAHSADSITFATPEGFNDELRSSITYFLEKDVKFAVALTSEFNTAFQRLYKSHADPNETEAFETDSDEPTSTADIERLKEFASDAPIVRKVAELIAAGVQQGASDIHIEPLQDRVRVRLRIDGILKTLEILPKSDQLGIISRIKIMSRLNIAETRLPQDGRTQIPVRGRKVDFRVATSPTIHGESAVLRILDKANLDLAFGNLGFKTEDAEKVRNMLSVSNGMVLVSGPTGSGKTTTLYSSLEELNCEDRKLLTVEDPVEYNITGVNQIQVHPQIGMDYERALRSLLRQDPDVIMIGEIRDPEPAKIAVQASLTGHLVLSTTHTNSAATTISRLLDLGVEPFLLASTLRGVIGQRLVRKLCKNCMVLQDPPDGFAEFFGLSDDDLIRNKPAKIAHALGCASCQRTGYSGRTVIYEIIQCSQEVEALISKGASSDEIEKECLRDGTILMKQCGLEKILNHETSFDEVVRATRIN